MQLTPFQPFMDNYGQVEVWVCVCVLVDVLVRLVITY